MNTSTSTHPHHARRRRHFGLALPIVAAAALLLGACGDDETASDDLGDAPTATAADAPDMIDIVDPADTTGMGDGGDAAGDIEPAQACGLLDPASVDSWLGTSGVTTEIDTSLGLSDGCRWAIARTDVPALIIGYGPTMEFAQVRELACEGTTPTPAPGAGADAVACFGAVIAPAGAEGIGVVLTSVDDPTFGLDDAARLDVATRAAAAIAAG